jgi:murein L,D-transpeptidase YcbB/YkuD
MRKEILALLIAAIIILPLAFYGCKPKAEKLPEMPKMEALPEGSQGVDMSQQVPVTEPAQNVAMETIPPTAAPQVEPAAVTTPAPAADRNKEIQTALARAGYYTGPIDGKIGPKSKRAIEEFQKAKGLKVDGKVGPKTWSELEKYLIQQ